MKWSTWRLKRCQKAKSTWTGKCAQITSNRHRLCLKLQGEEEKNKQDAWHFPVCLFFENACPLLIPTAGRRPLVRTCSLFAPTCTRWQWATASASRNTACKTCTAIKRAAASHLRLNSRQLRQMFCFCFGFHRQSLVHLPATADLLTGVRVVLTHRQWGRRGPQRHWTNTLCTSH